MLHGIIFKTAVIFSLVEPITFFWWGVNHKSLLALENKNKKMGQLYEGKYAADVVVEF
jgi:hypothetical protein